MLRTCFSVRVETCSSSFQSFEWQLLFVYSCFGASSNGASYHIVVTSNVDAVYVGYVGNRARFVSHDVVYFIFRVSIRASPCPSHPCFLLKLCVHDL